MHHKRHRARRKLVTRYLGPREAYCDIDARALPPKLEERRARLDEREQRADLTDGGRV